MDAILAFHSIDASRSVLSYAPDELARLLDALLEQGVRFAPLRDLLAAPDDPRPRVAITFDDGLRSVRVSALPLLAARRLPFTVFVVSGFVGRDNRWPSQPAGIEPFDLMDWRELEELRDAGAGIGGHTATHARLRGLDAAALAREIDDSRRAIEDRLSVAVASFAYPYGVHDAAAVARVRSVHEIAVTTRLRFCGEPPAARDRHLLPRLDGWYLRAPQRLPPLFSARSRARLAWRALLRAARGAAYGS